MVETPYNDDMKGDRLKHLAVYVSPELMVLLREYAKMLGVSLSEAASRAMLQGLPVAMREARNNVICDECNSKQEQK